MRSPQRAPLRRRALAWAALAATAPAALAQPSTHTIVITGNPLRGEPPRVSWRPIGVSHAAVVC